MSKPSIAIIGGTGDLGTGLAYRWAKAGHPIIIGSRTQDKAEVARAALAEKLGDAGISAMENAAAAEAADIICITVPFAHQKPTLETIRKGAQGKIFIDTTVSLVPPKVGRVQLPEEGSAGQIAQNLLGDDVRVVSAFQNVPAAMLQTDAEIDCDVLVSGNDKHAKAQVLELVQAADLRGFNAGLINNAAAAEALTSILININRQFKCHAGIRITGLEAEEH